MSGFKTLEVMTL